MVGWRKKREARRLIRCGAKRRAEGENDPNSEKIRQYLAAISGEVLEIGTGSGYMIRYLPSGVRYTALEPNEYLVEAITAQINEKGLADARVVTARAEQMPFKGASFDVVFSVWTLCAVQDLAQTLREVRRVLKPGGVFIFAEHVVAPTGSIRYLAQKIRSIFYSCSFARDIEKEIRGCGLEVVALERFNAMQGRYVMKHRIVGMARKSENSIGSTQSQIF
jgi:SAM-dependent methyltransferase